MKKVWDRKTTNHDTMFLQKIPSTFAMFVIPLCELCEKKQYSL